MYFQTALLYTSSVGERRIRVHTLALPVTKSLTEVFNGADQQAITSLVAKMGVFPGILAAADSRSQRVIAL